MANIKVAATPRNTQGSAEVRRLRRQGMVPAIIYGLDRANEKIQINEHEFKKALRHHAGAQLILDLAIDDQPPRKVLLKELQQHPFNDHILHVDFFEFSMTRKLRIAVPIVLKGDPLGVTQQGGQLEQILREVEIECLPADIMEQIEVDVSGLQLSQTFMISGLGLDPAKYTVHAAKEQAVAAVKMPKLPTAEEQAAEAGAPAEAAAEGAEPELIAKKKEDEEGAAAEAAPAEKGKEKGKEKEKKK